MRAWIRDLYGLDHVAEFQELDTTEAGLTPVAITVPVFGLIVLVQRGPDDWGAAYTTGNRERDATLGLPTDRPVKVVDGHIEIEMLANVSGEDRVVVCFEP